MTDKFKLNLARFIYFSFLGVPTFIGLLRVPWWIYTLIAGVLVIALPVWWAMSTLHKQYPEPPNIVIEGPF